MDKDYIVMRASQYGDYLRHSTKKNGQHYAERLALEHNDQFVLLEVVGSVRPRSNVVWDEGKLS